MTNLLLITFQSRKSISLSITSFLSIGLRTHDQKRLNLSLGHNRCQQSKKKGIKLVNSCNHPASSKQYRKRTWNKPGYDAVKTGTMGVPSSLSRGCSKTDWSLQINLFCLSHKIEDPLKILTLSLLTAFNCDICNKASQLMLSYPLFLRDTLSVLAVKPKK